MSRERDLEGKLALVAGISDGDGFAWAIAKSLAERGATIIAGTWPPVLGIFRTLLEKGKLDEERKLSDGRTLNFEKVYPLDVVYDSLTETPDEIKNNKRYIETGDFTLEGLVQAIQKDFGEKSLDIVVHSIANGPEVKKPLLETSRNGYLAALSASAYSMVAMVQRLAPLMKEGASFLSLTYLASTRMIPGYGGGMSSAKAALESDTRTLAFEAGRKYGIRVNCISAGPAATRAAKAIGTIDKMIQYTSKASPLPRPIEIEDVGNAAAFLLSPQARAVTGQVIYVDNGYSIMGMSPEE